MIMMVVIMMVLMIMTVINDGDDNDDADDNDGEEDMEKKELAKRDVERRLGPGSPVLDLYNRFITDVVRGMLYLALHDMLRDYSGGGSAMVRDKN